MTQVATVSSPETPPQLQAPTAPSSIDTRFGEVALAPERLINFPNGVLGFTNCRRFALVDLPDLQVAFKLLQSVDDRELAFLVLPIDPVAGPISRRDLELACDSLGFVRQALAVLGIVTIRSDADGLRFSINLKAPLLIDTDRQVGRQHVLDRKSVV